MANSPGSRSTDSGPLGSAFSSPAEHESAGGELTTRDIRQLLPHDGAMCLLDVVTAWNETGIVCQASSHRDATNPLRHGEILPIHCGIEYVAQAMAIHGTLCEQRAGRPRVGYLAVLSNVDWYAQRLDDLDGNLEAQADKLMATDAGFNYAFRLLHGTTLLLEGQAVVALQDAPG